MTQIKQLFRQIAREHLLIPTLECQNSDSLDFHDLSVQAIQAALNAAYVAGGKEKSLTLTRQFDRKRQAILHALTDSDSPSFSTEQVQFLQDRLSFTSSTPAWKTKGTKS
jgi:hypothetical protein